MIQTAISKIPELDDQSKLNRYDYTLRFSGKFKHYNGNIRQVGKHVTVSLSKNWIDVDKDITIGLIHVLFLRLFRLNTRTTENIDLYDSFIKNISVAIKKTQQNPYLKIHFDDLNNRFFNGLLDTPNLILGRLSKYQYGNYNYMNDTISISDVLVDDVQLMRYVLYHEMLHKHLKYKTNKGKTYYHTREFRKLEKQYPNSEILEKRLKNYSRKTQVRSFIKRLFK